ncbi:MAG TPA: cytochrome c [Roseovarius sp.]
MLSAVLVSVCAVAGVVSAVAQVQSCRCAARHGSDADGREPMGTVLVQPVAPTPLRFTNFNLSLKRALERLRDPSVSPGALMPLCGDFPHVPDMSLKTAFGPPIMTRRPIADLVAGLRTIRQLLDIRH